MKKVKFEIHDLYILFKNYVIYFLCEILSKAAIFLLTPIYTRILSTEEFGKISYFQIISNFLIIFLSYGFSSSQIRFYFEKKNETDFGSYIFTNNLFQLFLFLISILIFVIINYFFKATNIFEYKLFNTKEVLLLLILAFEITLIDNIVSYHKMKQEFLIVSLFNFIKVLLMSVFTIYFVVCIESDSFSWLLGQVIGITILFLFLYPHYASVFFIKFEVQHLSYSLSYGIPIIIHLLISTIHSSIDRIMLKGFIDNSILGIYSVGITISAILQVLVYSFNQIYQPYFYKLLNTEISEQNYKINLLYKIWMLVIAISTIIFILLNNIFIDFIVGQSFSQVKLVLPYLIFSVYCGSFYYLFSPAIFYYKKTKFLPIITTCSAIINIILNYLLIPSMGMVGAAISTIISHIVLSIATFYYSKNIHKFTLEKSTIWYFIISISIMSIVFLHSV